MESVSHLHLYDLPEDRRDAPKRSTRRIRVSSTSYHGYLALVLEGGPAPATESQYAIILGAQLEKATKNCQNTVRGCMTVECTLDTFDAAPSSWEESKKMTKREKGMAVIVSSTAFPAYVEVSLSRQWMSCLLKGEEILAAVENAARNVT